MIGYVTIGTNDMEKATPFYEAILGGELGAKRAFDYPTFRLWATSPKAAGIAITPPYNKEPATIGNGMMIALAASSKEQVDAIHKKALELGGTCEGPPGPRSGGFYIGYFRDLDGNKLNAFFVTGEK